MSPEKELPSLRDAGGTEIERRLLASASEDAIPEARYRALVEWSAGAASTAVRATPAGSTWKPAMIKGLGLLALAASGLGVFEYLSSPSRPSSAPVVEPGTSSAGAEAEPAVATPPSR